MEDFRASFLLKIPSSHVVARMQLHHDRLFCQCRSRTNAVQNSCFLFREEHIRVYDDGNGAVEGFLTLPPGLSLTGGYGEPFAYIEAPSKRNSSVPISSRCCCVSQGRISFCWTLISPDRHY